MVSELIDTIASLVLIMDEETARLQQPGRLKDHGELAAAKLRLVGTLEQRVAELARGGPNWLDNLDRPDRDLLLSGLATLRRASDSNSHILTRQIDLSTELMAVVAAEAQRQTGRRSASYRGSGLLTAADVAAPISVNASL